MYVCRAKPCKNIFLIVLLNHTQTILVKIDALQVQLDAKLWVQL